MPLDIVELGKGLAVAVAAAAPRMAPRNASMRAVGPGEQPRRGLADMADAERIDEAVEPDVAARLDGGEEVLGRRLAPTLAFLELRSSAVSRSASVKMSGGDWIRPSS